MRRLLDFVSRSDHRKVPQEVLGHQPLRAGWLLSLISVLFSLPLIALAMFVAMPEGWSPRALLPRLAAPFVEPLTVRPPPAVAPTPAAPTLPAATPRGSVAYGDRLKITFFESFDVALERGGGADRAIATVFPRMDLSAEYTIDEGGAIDIPKLGQFAAAGQPVPALQSALATAFRRTIGRPSDVHVTIIDRQPIYVIGQVRNAGAFRYASGMTVLQALAQAGGTQTSIADTSGAIESIREAERLRDTMNKHDRLLIRQARLVAERYNSEAIALSPDIRSRLSGTLSQQELGDVVDAETAILIAERQSYLHQLSLAERRVGIAAAEIEARQKRADQLQVLIDQKAARLHEVEAVASRGSVPKFRVLDLNVDLSELLSHQQDSRVALVEAQGRRAEAEIARARIELEHSVGLAKEIALMAQQIADCRHAIDSMRSVGQVLHEAVPGFDAAPHGPPHVTIVRRGTDGVTTIRATDSAWLTPGDVVQVRLADRAEQPISEDAGAPASLPKAADNN